MEVMIVTKIILTIAAALISAHSLRQILKQCSRELFIKMIYIVTAWLALLVSVIWGRY